MVFAHREGRKGVKRRAFLHPCRDNGQYQPADSENFRQTNAQQGVRGRANHISAAPPTALFFCTVNGTFSFRRDEKKMWGWNSGFWKIPRSCWLKPRKHTPQVRETYTCSTHESFLQELAARYFPPAESTQRPLGRFDAPQTPGDSSSAGGLVTRCI